MRNYGAFVLAGAVLLGVALDARAVDAKSVRLATCYVKAIDQAEDLKPKEKEALASAVRGCLDLKGKFTKEDVALVAKVLAGTVLHGALGGILEGTLKTTATAPEILDGMNDKFRKNQDLRDKYLPEGCHGSSGKSPCGK